MSSPEEEPIRGTVGITGTAQNEEFQKQATDIMKKIDNFSTKIKNQREERNKMLQNIYKTIADMNLKYEDDEFVKPTNEAELVTAIEFLKTNDSIEKEKLKDLNALYDTIKKSELPGADRVEVASKLSLTNFIDATKTELKAGDEALIDANKTIDGCQKHFDDIEYKLSEMGEIVDPNSANLPGPGSIEQNQQTKEDKKNERDKKAKNVIEENIDSLNKLCNGIFTGARGTFGMGITFTLEQRFKSLVEETTTTIGGKELEKKIHIKKEELSELLNIKLLLMYLKLSTFKVSSEVDKFLGFVNKQLDTILSKKFFSKNVNIVKDLLFKLTGVSADGETIPEKVPELAFKDMCVVLFYLKDTGEMKKTDFRPGSGTKIGIYLQNCIDVYSKAVDAELIKHIVNTEGNKLTQIGTNTTMDGVNTDIKSKSDFISRMFSSKTTGGKTMKKRRNLNKGGKTIRKMLKRTLKRGGNFIKKLTKRK